MKKALALRFGGQRVAWWTCPPRRNQTRRGRAHAFVRIRPRVLERTAAESQGQSAGDRAHRRHRRRQAHLRADSAVPSADAVARRCRGDGGKEAACALSPALPPPAQTGVEMEALTAAAVAALTVYDMTKALDKSIEIQDLYLLEKTGGKSGEFHREVQPTAAAKLGKNRPPAGAADETVCPPSESAALVSVAQAVSPASYDCFTDSDGAVPRTGPKSPVPVAQRARKQPNHVS